MRNKKKIGINSKSLLSKVKAAIFGYDIFISYSRKDSLDYAFAMASYFIDKKYEAFIDQISNTKPGESIPEEIIKAIKRSKGMILIGSQCAQLSKENDPISQEVEFFLNNNGSKFLIPINIAGAIDVDKIKRKESNATIIEKKIFGLTLCNESQKDFDSKKPSKEVLDKIEKALKFTKKSIRLRRIAILTSLSVILISGIVIGSSVFFVKKASQKVLHSNQLAANAEKKAFDAQQKELRATNEATNQTEKARIAGLKAETALHSQIEAENKTLEANKQAKEALFLADVNKTEARSINSMNVNGQNNKQEKALDLLLQNDNFLSTHPNVTSPSILKSAFALNSSITSSYPLANINSPIENLYVGSNEKYAVSIHESGQIFKWNIQSKKLDKVIPLGCTIYDRSSFNKQSNILAIAENDGRNQGSHISIFNVDNLSFIDSFDVEFAVEYITLLNNNPKVVISGENNLIVRDYELKMQKTPNTKIHHPFIVQSNANDSEILVVERNQFDFLDDTKDKRIEIWRSNFINLIGEINCGDVSYISDVLFTDNREIFTTHNDGSIRKWKLNSDKSFTIFLDSTNVVFKMAQNVKDNKIAFISRKKIFVWDNKEQKVAYELKPKMPISDAILSDKHNSWITIGGSGGPGIEYLKKDQDKYFGEMLLWNAYTGVEERSCEGHSEEISAIVVSDTLNRIISGDYNGEIRIWDINNDLSLKKFATNIHFVNDFQGTPQSNIAVISGANSNSNTDSSFSEFVNGICFLDINNLKEKSYFKIHKNFIEGIKFTPDMKKVISWDRDGLVVLWDAGNKKELREIQTQVKNITDVSFSTNGKILSIGGFNTSQINLYDLSTGLFSGSIQGFNYAQFVGRNNILLIKKGKEIQLRDLNSQNVLWTTPIQTNDCKPILSNDMSFFITLQDGPVTNLYSMKNGKIIQRLSHRELIKSGCFSPKGNLLVTCGMDGAAKVWNSRGKLIHSFIHSGWVNHAFFSKNNKLLLTVSDDGTARVWDIQTGELLTSLNGNGNKIINGWFINNDKNVIVIDEHGIVRTYSVDLKEIYKMLKKYKVEFETKRNKIFEKNVVPSIVID